jgi:hypothetical protein
LNAKAVKRRRVEITFECERSLVVGRRKTSIKGWGEGCGLGVRTVTPDETNRYARADDLPLGRVPPISFWLRIGRELVRYVSNR